MTKVQPSLKAASEVKDDTTISKSVPTFMIDPRTLVIKAGFNSRPIVREHVEYFKALRKAGVDIGYRTVQMVDGERIIRDGHHRHTADMELIAEGFPIAAVKAAEFKGTEEEAIFLMLATQSGLAYTPLQLGEQYKKLVNMHGLSYDEIARQRGCSAQNVKDALRLADQPTELKNLIEAGEVKSSTALKLVKKTGSGEQALATVKEAIATKPKATTKSGAPKPLTQKVIDNLGKNVVTEAAKRTQVAREYIQAWLDSPSLPDATKRVLTQMRDLCNGIAPTALARDAKAEKKVIVDFVGDQKAHANSEVRHAAHVILDLIAGKKLPDGDTGEAAFYRHMVWLQNMAEASKEPTFRAAAHWFMAVLNIKRSGGELAPAPSVLSLEDALIAERDSEGHVLAETLCPEQTDLIKWLRGRA